MTFAVFLPEEAQHGPVPVLWFLSGLTCTHENAMVKAGAQAWAAEQGIAVVFPDTSPRGEGVPDDAAFDLGRVRGSILMPPKRRGTRISKCGPMWQKNCPRFWLKIFRWIWTVNRSQAIRWAGMAR